jgi:hypothetical protein
MATAKWTMPSWVRRVRRKFGMTNRVEKALKSAKGAARSAAPKQAAKSGKGGGG